MPRIETLMLASIAGISPAFYDERQTAVAVVFTGDPEWSAVSAAPSTPGTRRPG